MTGPICRDHWGRLVDVMSRAADLAPVLEQGAAKGGEQVVRSTTSPTPARRWARPWRPRSA
jgi:hypothetical protein